MDLELLEKKGAAKILLAVSDSPGITKSRVTAPAGYTDKTLYNTVSALVAAELIREDTAPRTKNAIELYLTERGYTVASFIKKIEKT